MTSIGRHYTNTLPVSATTRNNRAWLVVKQNHNYYGNINFASRNIQIIIFGKCLHHHNHLLNLLKFTETIILEYANKERGLFQRRLAIIMLMQCGQTCRLWRDLWATPSPPLRPTVSLGLHTHTGKVRQHLKEIIYFSL